jgi:hypothetical protein
MSAFAGSTPWFVRQEARGIVVRTFATDAEAWRWLDANDGNGKLDVKYIPGRGWRVSLK